MIDLEKKLQTADDFAEFEEIAEEDVAIENLPEEEAEGETPEEETSADVEEELMTIEDEEDLDSEDSLTFSNGVIEKIVAIAMRSVPGVVGMSGGWFDRLQDAFGAKDTRKGVSVEVTPDSAVRVNVSVLIEYGAYAPQVFEDVKKAIVGQVTGMTGLPIAGVNLRIVDVLTPEEIAARYAAAAAPESEPEAEDEISLEELAAEAEAVTSAIEES